MTEVTLIQPDPRFVSVKYCPSYEHGDCVAIELDDFELGRFLVVMAPETAGELATLLATAVKSPRVTALADQVKAGQRQSGR